MTHTPGPWQVDGDTYVTKNSLIIAHCKQHGHTELEQALANARLISSAPDLLAALKGLCADMLRRGVEHSDEQSIKAWDKAQDAIARARGE